MMKRASLILFLVTLASMGVFADTLDFSVKWYVSNIAVTDLSIIPYSGEGSFPTIVPQGGGEAVSYTELFPEGTEQVEVCRIRFATNVHALYNLDIRATSMYCEEQASSMGYSLHLSYDATQRTYEVSSNSTLASDGTVIQIGMWGTGTVTKDVMVKASFSELDSMLPGTYQATIKVEASKE